MKKYLLITVAILHCITISNAQVPELWGMTTFGGTSGGGTIFKVDGDGTGFTSLFSFDPTTGTNPRGSLCLAPNGKLYGTANGGGSQSVGTLFCFNPVGSICTKIVDFNYTNGAYPWGSLMLASNGMLYGSSYGGTNGDGNIFRINPAANAFNVLYNLGSGDGASPGGRMVEAANGLLYGMTAYSGVNSGGTIFSFNPVGNVFTNVHDFNTPDGKTGYGSLFEATDGNLYGLARNGGAYGVGALFRFNPSGNIYTKLVDFDTANGKWPWNELMQVAGTKLYGMTTNGGANGFGLIFSYDFSSGTYTLEHSFDQVNGSIPFGALMQASDNYLYGMTFNGGTNLLGTVFKFDTANDSLAVIHSFNGTDGSNPPGDLLEMVLPTATYSSGDEFYYSIYPNPTAGIVYLKGKSAVAENMHLILTNSLGITIREEDISVKRNSFSIKLDLQDSPAGIYLLTIKSGGNQVNGKILKR